MTVPIKPDEVAALAADAAKLAVQDVASDLRAADERKAVADDRRESRAFWQAIILAGCVAAPGVVAAWRINATEVKVDAVHDLANSRLTELLEVTETSSRAEGVLEGKAEGKASKGDKP